MLDVPSPSIAPADIWRHGEEAGALVFGGAHGSLSVVRSLGRRGIPVWLLRRDNPIARLSRYASGSIPWEGPAHADAADTLVAIAERYRLKGAVLFPGGDAEAELVSQHHAKLSRAYRVTTPPWSRRYQRPAPGSTNPTVSSADAAGATSHMAATSSTTRCILIAVERSAAVGSA